MAGVPRPRAGGGADLDRAVVWVCGSCVAAGAAAGAGVGWLYGRDQATRVDEIP